MGHGLLDPPEAPTLDVYAASNMDGHTPLYRAVTQGNAECAQTLISHPLVNVNIECGKPGQATAIEQTLYMAAEKQEANPDPTVTENFTKIIKAFLERKETKVAHLPIVFKIVDMDMLDALDIALNHLMWIQAVSEWCITAIARCEVKENAVAILANSERINLNCRVCVEGCDDSTVLIEAFRK